MRAMILLAAPLLMTALSGCVVRTAANVVTLPVRAGAQAADWATTSQDEADRNYGRRVREQEARDAKERKKAEKQRREQCRRAGYSDCD